MRATDRLVPPAYGLATLLVLVPILDVLLQVWPLDPTEASWRFGAIGILSRSLLTPLLGLLLAMGTAAAAGHRPALRLTGALSGLLAFGLIGVGAVFALDGLELRAVVAPGEPRGRFDRTAFQASVKLGLFILLALAYAIFAWLGVRDEKRERKVVRAPSGPGIVASDARRRSSGTTSVEGPARGIATVTADAPQD
jgi:hypothetical protein